MAAGAVLAVLAGAGTASAAGSPKEPDPLGAPPQVHGPEVKSLAAAGGRPVSGKSPSAGPTFTQAGGVWQVDRTMAVLSNTVTDPDGDKADLTFAVYTTDAFGNPDKQVMIKDEPYGVLVSGYVNSGGTAKVTVPDGNLKPGTTYAFRTSAYDGSPYETEWSPWAKFKTRGRAVDIKLPEPDKNALALNEDDFQEPQKIAQPAMAVVPPTVPPTGLRAASGWNCGKVNSKTDIQPCSRIVPGVSKKARQSLIKQASSGLPHLVDWCETYADSHIKRYEACISGFTYEYQGIVVKDGKPTGEVLNASWAVGQEVKLSGTSGTFTQQLILVPLEVDPKFVSVTLDVEFDCLVADDCSNGPQSWDGALEWTGADPFSHPDRKDRPHLDPDGQHRPPRPVHEDHRLLAGREPGRDPLAGRRRADPMRHHLLHHAGMRVLQVHPHLGDELQEDAPGCSARVVDPVQAAQPSRKQGRQQAHVLLAGGGQERARS
ncbi:fibronectin type III domain-containing protein [Streptomyces noursei]|uniref:fibronectin type III domain-containing protein n=1 Tax=Streptomyces noursei TaxID=1971 RepID=UPI00130071F8|nr:fibronectin type III domain-containing protein [Streptomyces noursei]